MRRKINCVDCGCLLTKDEIALNKKLVSANTEKFRCLECLSLSFDFDVEDLRIKIEEFKEQGCTLFL